MIGSLYLSPRSPEDVCEPATLARVLDAMHITATPMSQQPRLQVYRAGEGFARHIVYAGCSPHLRFEPEHKHDQHFCHVALHGPFEQARVLTAGNTVKPRCPHCRQRLADWLERLDKTSSPCPGCGRNLTVRELDWRQHAAVGRCLVELRNVFPGEASPSDQLLAELEKATGFAWRYAWSGLNDGS
jgi:hypothetical protein